MSLLWFLVKSVRIWPPLSLLWLAGIAKWSCRVRPLLSFNQWIKMHQFNHIYICHDSALKLYFILGLHCLLLAGLTIYLDPLEHTFMDPVFFSSRSVGLLPGLVRPSLLLSQWWCYRAEPLQLPQRGHPEWQSVAGGVLRSLVSLCKVSGYKCHQIH